MANLEEAHYTTEYTGLISTASLALGFMVVMTTAYETYSRLPRRLSRKLRRTRSENEQSSSVEDYVMAYLYRPRVFLGKHRGPQIPKWPLAWIPQVLKIPQSWYLQNAGLDAAVYVRFVTGCWYFMLSQVCTTFIIILPLHLIYAPGSILPSNIAKASVASLIDSQTGGRKYLWVHTVLLWWMSACWITNIVYVGWGNIRMRREQLLMPYQDAKDGDTDEEKARLYGGQGADGADQPGMPPGLSTRGWRFRTVKVSNVPQHMRNDQALREYFDGCLAFLKKNPTARFYESAFHPTDGISNGSSPTLTRHSSGFPPAGSAAAMSNPNTAVAHVTIVRKLTELHELVEKRREVIHELESAHVILARTVMQAVGDRVRRRAHQSNLREKVLHRKEKGSTEALDELVEALGEFLPVDKLEYTLWQQMHPEKRSASLLPSRTIWEALADLSPELLDPYQPITKLKVFRGQVAPSIDYYLTKLNLLTSLVDELRARPDSYAACDTAFVTFYSAKDARLIKRELSWIRARGLSCRVRSAPDTRDLDWNKLVQANFRGDVLRGFIVHALVWVATIIWILPMGALVGLVSLDNLSTRIPALASWLTNHQKIKSLASTLIPTIIVAVVNMLVPTIIIQVSGRGQTFVTLSKLHHATWCRYWKWVIINVVIAFCAGTALFTSILGIFTGDSFSDTASNPLNIIASSFSNGAVFFVSYTILVIATQCFFELGQFMIPWFLFLGVRKATTPRQRFAKTIPRRFFSYTVSPNHCLIIAIVLTFGLLNPLPIGFIFVYFSIAVCIFKDHFARLYWRVYYELNGRLMYMRIMRYSLDALVLGQVVNMALFFVLKDAKNGGACAALIPITVIIKLVLTRWYDSHMDAADSAYADIMCHPHQVDPSKSLPEDDGTHKARTARRHAVNEHLNSMHLPELSLWATIKSPISGRGLFKTTKGPQAVITRIAQQLQNSGAYAELKGSDITREDANVSAAKDLAAPSAEKTLEALESPQKRAQQPEHERTRLSRMFHQQPVHQADAPLAVPHEKLKRDDRPNYSAPYIDPYLVEPMERSLWLPRDPLFPIDLDDTIDWYGSAIVSSEGGDGKIGQWNGGDSEDGDYDDDIAQEQDETAVEEILDTQSTSVASPNTEDSLLNQQLQPAQSPISSGGSVSSATPAIPRTSTPTASPRRTSRLHGTERIRVAGEVANRLGRSPSVATSNGTARQNSASPSGFPALGRQRTPGSISTHTVSSSTSEATATLQVPPFNLSRPNTANAVPTIASPASIEMPLPEPSILRRAQSEVVPPPSQSRVIYDEPLSLEGPRSAQSTGLSAGVFAPAAHIRTQRSNTRLRSGSRSSAGGAMSSAGDISQSRALVHEVMQEQREEAVQRRQEETKKMRSRMRNAKSTWRNWFMEAPDDVD